MTVEEFLLDLQAELGEENKLTPETNLKSLEVYDSMTLLIIIAFIDENFNTKIEAKQFKIIETVRDLMDAVGMEKFTSK